MDKIVISTTTFGIYDSSPLVECKKRGFEIILNSFNRKLKPDELVVLAKGAIGLIAGTEPISEETLSKLPFVKVISRCGAGLSNIDAEAAKKRGIKIYNTPDAPTCAVAELTIGLILGVLRKIALMDRESRQGRWQKRMGNLLHDKKIGIIGFGRIGRMLVRLLGPFGSELAYSDRLVRDGVFGLKRMPLEELLGWADIISLHVSGEDRILGPGEIKAMKNGAWLINTSRGGVVDEHALFEALKEGHLSGAAIDVFEKEPYDGPLKGLDNVILTPHVGSYAKEARVRMEARAVENLLKGLGHSSDKGNNF